MGTKRVGAAGPVPFSIDPGQLPDDGSPVTFEQTFAKRLGTGAAQQNPLTEEDFENSEWLVEKLEGGTWGTHSVVRGRPSQARLKDEGPGRYRIAPLDRTRNNRKIESLEQTITILDPSGGLRSTNAPEAPARTVQEGVDMPAWMQMMFQQQAEERAETRRKAEEAERRREAWEREQALKEEARREREERMAEVRAEREAQAAREAAERNNALILAGLELARHMVTRPQPQPVVQERRDDRIQELLLGHILQERTREPVAAGGSLKESIEMLMALDQVAQARADRIPPPPEREEKEEDFGDTMMKMLPMMVGGAMQRGGGGGGQPQLPAINPEALLARALEDPALIAKVAARNPEAIARTFSKVVKSNPQIEKAVIDVLSADEGADEEGQ